jgi:RNA polymerase sigma-70 factor (ECF subfamily)
MTTALWRSFDRYDASRPFATWMYRVCLNVAISFFRSEERYIHTVRALDEIGGPAQSPPADPRVAQLLECIDELGAFDKALVLLHLDGYAHAEIASILGISSTNAATKLARIKDRLRQAVTALANEEGSVYGKP